MSKKLYLVRHGESMGNAWPDAYGDDKRNFLSPLGVKQAELTGAFFKRMGINFELVSSSDMTRARHTTACILHEIGWQRKWFNTPELNEVNSAQDQPRVRKVFRELRNAFTQLEGNMLVVSHYHTMQVLFDEITGGDRALVDSYEGRHVGNAAVFVWNPEEPKRIQLVDLTQTGQQY